MKQQYTFSNLFSVLPFLLAAFLWLGGSSVYAGGKGQYPTSLTTSGGGSFCEDAVATETLTAGFTFADCSNAGTGGTIDPTVSYQWYADGVAIPGATNSTYDAPLTPPGSVTYYCELSWTSANGEWINDCISAADLGPANTPSVVVTVSEPPTTAAAGPDQNLPGTCETSATLAANTPTIGTGTWTISPAAPGATFSPSANDPNATVSGLDAATAYTFTWTISSPGCPPSTDDVIITTGPLGPGCWNYCNLDFTDCDDEVITSVSMAGFDISSSSNCPSTSSYTDETNGTCIDVVPGNTYELCVTLVMNGSWTNNTWAFFDWDNNGTFETSEDLTQIAGSGTLCLNITVPAGATPGNTVMRIVTSESGDPSACSAPSAAFGDVIDICVNVYDCSLTTTPLAGPDQDLTGTCTNTATMAANTITEGTGLWVLISGSGTITDPFDPLTTITDLGPGTNTFEWQANNDPCPQLTDQVDIINNSLPTISDAGADMQTCNGTFAAASANSPAIGETGVWTCTGGACGSVGGLPSIDPNQVFTLPNTPGTTATLTWTITQTLSGCTSTDEVVLTVISGVTTADAGPDQVDVCYTAFSNGNTVLAANTPVVGNGAWTVVSNTTGGTVDDLSDPTSSVSGISATGSLVLDWVITSPGCASSIDQVTITTILCNADNACVAQPLAVTSGSCSYSTFSNAGLTEITGIPELTCDESTGPDIWFSVIVPASGQFQADVDDVSGIDPMMGAYDGDCSSPESSGCIDGAGTDVGPLTYAGEPGSTVYLRVNPTSTITTEGNFNICAYEATTATISEVLPGVTTTITCGETLDFYDPGGQGGTTTTNTSQPPPPGNYSNNTGASWEICPDDPSQYVQVTFNEFTLESGFDKLIIMSADTVIAQWTGNDGQGDVVTSINPGECLQFILQSDYIWTAEGWEALVECTNTPVPAQISNACEVRNCNGGCGVWVCLDGVYDTQAGAGAGIDEVNEVTGGCWGAAGEVATSWFYFTTNQAGSLGFEFIPSNNGHNINFALYGPSTDGVPPCPLSTGDAPIRCSFVDIGGGNTGLYGDSTATGVITTNPASTDYYDGLDGDGFAAPVDVQAGETYALVVDVYQNGQPPTETEIDFSGVELDCTVLPIELADFSGVNQGEYNLLSWITYSERNNDYFTIYRSVDGYHWEEVGKVDGAGNSSRPLHYTLNDMEPHFPITYYRLKQTDMDGEFKWSETISISTIKKSEDEFITDLFPNPSSTYATFTYTGHNTAEPLNVQVVNTFGEVVINLDYTKVTKNMPATIVTGQLAEGLYHVTFRQGNKSITKRLAVIR